LVQESYEPKPGILIALGAALLFGASTPLAKLALSSANPLLVAGLLYLGSGIGLFVVRTIRFSKTTETPLSRADLPWLGGAILAGIWSRLHYYWWGS
jgi:drug/metabolite transporter (DMT)-like permease